MLLRSVLCTLLLLLLSWWESWCMFSLIFIFHLQFEKITRVLHIIFFQNMQCTVWMMSTSKGRDGRTFKPAKVLLKNFCTTTTTGSYMMRWNLFWNHHARQNEVWYARISRCAWPQPESYLHYSWDTWQNLWECFCLWVFLEEAPHWLSWCSQWMQSAA